MLDVAASCFDISARAFMALGKRGSIQWNFNGIKLTGKLSQMPLFQASQLQPKT
jgi:hypothetical protein